MSASGCDVMEMYILGVCQAASLLWKVEASDKCRYSCIAMWK